MKAMKKPTQLLPRILVPFLIVACLLLSACEPLSMPELSIPAQLTPDIATAPTLEIGVPTPMVEMTINFSPRVEFPKAYYSFSPVKDYLPFVTALESKEEENRLTLYNEDKSLFYSFSAEKVESAQTNEACLNAVLEKMKADWAVFSPGDIAAAAYPGNSSGFTFSGVLQDRASKGALVASYQNQQCYFFLSVYTDQMAGIGADALDLNLGATLFAAMLKTIEIGVPPAKPTCQISDDPEYGKTLEKPIQVGNTNIIDGKNRVELYLLTLRGPDDEEITFTRQQPVLNQNGDVVDVYSISYAGNETSTLVYFDIYTFAQPLAIHGFSCEAPFPLEKP